jgi:hypothetical protein
MDTSTTADEPAKAEPDTVILPPGLRARLIEDIDRMGNAIPLSLKQLWGDLNATGPAVVTEHAIGYKSGDRKIRCTEPDVEAVYPLAHWLEHMRQQGTTVQTRQIIVVSDWADVPAGPAADA